MYNQSVVRRVMRGDEMAFRILFEDWAEVVYAHAYDVLRDEEMAHDVVRRTFLDVYRLTPRLRDGRQFDEWLRRLVAYQCSEVALGRRALSEPAREQDWAHIARTIGIPPEEEEPPRRAPQGGAQEEEWQPILFYPEEDEQQFWYDEDQDPPTVAAAQAVPRPDPRSTDRAAMEAYLKTADHQPDAPQSAAQPEPLPIRPREKSEPALPEELLARPKEKAKQPRHSRKKAAQGEGERALSPQETAARAAKRRRRGDIAVASMLILATVLLAGSGVLLLLMHKGALQTPVFLQEASSAVGGLWEDIVRLVAR